MTRPSRWIPIAALFLAGCAAAPTPPVALAPLTAPLVTSGGLVIGTLSYQYVDVAERSDGTWTVQFERLDAPAAADQDYALNVEVDRERSSGVFSGTLPEGVYAFRSARAAERRYASGALQMPFEVHAGEVRDAGHYALNPIAR